jgi:hypothetical protein
LRLYRGPFLPGIRLAPISKVRNQIRTVLITEGLALLMTQDYANPDVALRLGRLRALEAEMQLPPLARPRQSLQVNE